MIFSSIGTQIGEFIAMFLSTICEYVTANNILSRTLDTIGTIGLRIAEPYLLETVFWYNKKWVHIHHQHQHAYASYPVYRGLVSFISAIGDMGLYVYQEIMGIERELSEPWIAVYGYQPDISMVKTHTIRLHEIKLTTTTRTQPEWYEDLFHSSLSMPYDVSTHLEKEDDDTLSTVILSNIEQVICQTKINENTQEYLPIVITKNHGLYSVHISFPPIIRATNKLVHSEIPSKVEFLYVEYSHSEMSKLITLNIPKIMMNVGNELFSPVFVLMMLEKQAEPFVFDKHYHLRIMDNDVNMIELTSDQYIQLEMDKYIIKRYTA